MIPSWYFRLFLYRIPLNDACSYAWKKEKCAYTLYSLRNLAC
jgi:hypothetical protein